MDYRYTPQQQVLIKRRISWQRGAQAPSCGRVTLRRTLGQAPPAVLTFGEAAAKAMVGSVLAPTGTRGDPLVCESAARSAARRKGPMILDQVAAAEMDTRNALQD